MPAPKTYTNYTDYKNDGAKYLYAGYCGSSSAPVISGVSGPASLQVGQQGTWTVNATSPNGGSLSHSVFWGDEVFNAATTGISAPAPTVSQSATFTHTYTSRTFSSSFTPTFTVTNSSGQSAHTTISVIVGPSATPSVTVIAPNGGERWITNSVQAITWKTSNAFSSSAKVDLYLDRPTFVAIACAQNSPCNPYYDMAYVLDKNIANTGSYSWIVGTDIVNNLITPGNYLVRVCLAGTTTCDRSDSTFTVVSQTISCAATEYSCPCATGNYCLRRGAACISPASACPVQ